MAEYYPPVAFHFKVEFSISVGTPTTRDARFMEVSGITQSMDTEQLKEGGNNLFSYKLPTRGNFGNLVLKRGFYIDSGIVEWVQKALDDQEFSPGTITVQLLTQDHESITRWDFYRAYPVKWDISALDAKKNDIVVETLELAYAYFKKS